LLEYQVEGILLTAATLSSKMAEECERWGRPVTMINRYVPGVYASWFCCANYEGGKMVARLLLDSKHQRPAFLAGSEDTTTSIDRERGFMEILNQEKVKALREVGEYTYQDAYDAALRLLDRAEPADAIFCANDIMALGVMDAAKNGLGLKVPEEVSIIGFDDISMSAWSSYDLTTIRQPIKRMVDASVEELLARIENPEKTPLQKVIPGELVIRSSARMPGGLSSGWVISQDR
jgi:DNA-binding LacI/PurR family transcriptional regulator